MGLLLEVKHALETMLSLQHGPTCKILAHLQGYSDLDWHPDYTARAFCLPSLGHSACPLVLNLEPDHLSHHVDCDLDSNMDLGLDSGPGYSRF